MVALTTPPSKVSAAYASPFALAGELVPLRAKIDFARLLTDFARSQIDFARTRAAPDTKKTSRRALRSVFHPERSAPRSQGTSSLRSRSAPPRHRSALAAREA